MEFHTTDLRIFLHQRWEMLEINSPCNPLEVVFLGIVSLEESNSSYSLNTFWRLRRLGSTIVMEVMG